MTTDRVGKVLDKFNRELRESLVFAEGGGDLERDIIAQLLESRIAPLLRAGQAMRDVWIGDDTNPNCPVECNADWDAALATLEGRDGK